MPNKIASQKKSNMPLYGTKGNDNLTVSAKLYVDVFAYAGNDTITVTKGADHKIYAGAGKDKITVIKGDYVEVYGDASEYDSDTNGRTTKGDKDTITVNDGKSIYVYGEAGNDVITVKKGTNIQILGGAGTDTIKVYGGSGHYIYGDYGYGNIDPKRQKKDNIYIYGGTFREIGGGGGGDIITVSKNAKGSTKVYDKAAIYGGAGGDTITVSAGTNYYISGDDGADSITLKNSTLSAEIYGGDGKDTITVSKSKNVWITGGAKNDTITVTGGTDNVIKDQEGNNTINVTSLKSSGDGYYSSAITCSSGSDTITLTNCRGCNVDPGGGANKITINGKNSKNNIIDYGSIDLNHKGDDIIDIKGGTGHKVTSYGGKVTVSGIGTTCDVTMWEGDGSATLKAGSKTTLRFWSYGGKFTINAAKGTLTGDLITFIWNTSDQFKFGHDGSALTLTGKNGEGSVTINNFTNGAFAGGITFKDKNLSYDTIKNKAWLS